MSEDVYTIEQLKTWFANGCKPTESHFAAIFTSFFHKGDNIPASQIDGMEEMLASLRAQLNEDLGTMVDAHNNDEKSHNIGALSEFTSTFETVFPCTDGDS